MATKMRLLGYGSVLGALIIAAGVPIAYKAASSIPVFELLMLVSLIGTLISFVLMLATGKQKHLKSYFTKKDEFLALAIYGVLAYFFVSFSLSYATHFVSANLAAVIYRTWPLMIVIIAPFIISERISKYDVLAVAIGFSGLAVVLLRGTSISIPLYELPFVVLLLFGALADAIASAVQKRYTYEIYSSLFMYNLIALALFLPLSIAFHTIDLSAINQSALMGLLFLGLLQNVALTFFFATAMRSVKTSTVGNVLLSVPFVTMVLSAVILKEAVMPYYIVIAIATVLGVAVQKLAPNIGNYLPKTSKGRWHMPVIYDVSSAFVNTKNEAVYNALKGEGRALAFYKPIGADEIDRHNELVKMLGSQSNAILFTDKVIAEGVEEDEMNFIKEIMGYKGNGLLVVGIGKPQEVEEIFYKIHSFGNQNISPLQSKVL